MGKIVVVTDFMYPNYVGGSSRYAHDFVKGLHDHHTDFLVITRKKSGVFGMMEVDDDFYRLLRTERKVIEVSLSPYSLFSTLHHIGRDDVLNIHHPVLGLFYLAFTWPRKITCTFHGPWHEEYRARGGNRFGAFLRRRLQALLLRRSEIVFVLSNYMRDKVSSIAENLNIKVVGPMVDFEKFKSLAKGTKIELRQKYGVTPETNVLFTCRRLTARTGVLELAEHFIRDFDPSSYVLIIVGQGELSGELSQIIGQAQNIKWYRSVGDVQLVELMRLSDVYVLPSRNLEGFGLVVLEAMSVGLPVVVSNQAGGGTDFINSIDQNLIFDMNDLSNSLKVCIRYLETTHRKDELTKIAEGFDLRVRVPEIAQWLYHA